MADLAKYGKKTLEELAAHYKTTHGLSEPVEQIVKGIKEAISSRPDLANKSIGSFKKNPKMAVDAIDTLEGGQLSKDIRKGMQNAGRGQGGGELPFESPATVIRSASPQGPVPDPVHKQRQALSEINDNPLEYQEPIHQSTRTYDGPIGPSPIQGPPLPSKYPGTDSLGDEYLASNTASNKTPGFVDWLKDNKGKAALGAGTVGALGTLASQFRSDQGVNEAAEAQEPAATPAPAPAEPSEEEKVVQTQIDALNKERESYKPQLRGVESEGSIQGDLDKSLTSLQDTLKNAKTNADTNQQTKLDALEDLTTKFRDEYKSGMDRQAMGELAETIGNAVALIGAGHATAKSAQGATPFDATKGLQLSKKDWSKGMDQLLTKLKVDLSEIKDKRDTAERKYGADIRQAERAYESGEGRAYRSADARRAQAGRADAANITAQNTAAMFDLRHQDKLAELNQKKSDAKTKNEQNLASKAIEQYEKEKEATLGAVQHLMSVPEEDLKKALSGKMKGPQAKEIVDSYTRASSTFSKDQLTEALKKGRGEENWFSADVPADPAAARAELAAQYPAPRSPGTAQAAQAQAPAAAPTQASGRVKLRDPATGKVAEKPLTPQVQKMIDDGLVEIVR